MNTTSIKNYLESFNLFTEEEVEEFIAQLVPKKLDKYDFFIKEGDRCKSVAFIQSGILRSYYTSDKDEETTYCISFPNNFMTAYSSFLTGAPTQENIQAITSVELLVLSKEYIDKLASKSPNYIFFSKLMAEQQYIELEQRFFQLQGSDATSRYKDLLDNHPKYIESIPLHYLSSYLGVSQRHLSRIRKEISI